MVLAVLKGHETVFILSVLSKCLRLVDLRNRFKLLNVTNIGEIGILMVRQIELLMHRDTLALLLAEGAGLV